MELARIAHRQGYENAAIYKSPQDQSVAVAITYASSIVLDYLTRITDPMLQQYAESKLNFIKTRSIDDFYECALLLGHEMENISACFMVEDQIVARELEQRLVRDGGVAHENIPALYQMRNSLIMITEWGKEDDHCKNGTLLVISPSLSAAHGEIFERELQFGLSRRYILFHQLQNIQINFS